MPKTLARCKKCGGKIIRDDGDFKCLNCGYEWKTRWQKHEFYILHKEEIAADIKTLGYKGVKEKWRLSGSTLQAIKLRASLPTPGNNSPEPNAELVHVIPAIPAFDNNWDPSVQIAWLGTMERIYPKNRKGKKENQQEGEHEPF